MTPEQIALLRSSLRHLPAKATVRLLYRRLFAIDPSLRPLFPEDMTDQCCKLVAMLAAFVERLDDLDRQLPAVRELGRLHADFDVTRAHYEAVGAALLWALRQTLGTAFTSETEAAWAALYRLLSTTMIEAAEEQVAAPRPATRPTRLQADPAIC